MGWLAAVEAQKRAPVDVVKAVLIEHGGVAPDSGPALRHLPPSHYRATIDALNALPDDHLRRTT